MKNKVFSFLVIVLFMSSSINLNAISAIEEEGDNCAEIAYELQGDLEDEGVPKQVANEVANLVYEICETAQD
jgi:hypothetical protein